MRVLGPGLFPLRLIAVVAGGATAATCLAIACRLTERRIALLAVLLLLASPLFDRMCSAAMNDIFVTLCFAVSVLLTLRLSEGPPTAASATPSSAASTDGRSTDDASTDDASTGGAGERPRSAIRLAVLLGLVLGIGLLVKYTMLLAYPVAAAIAGLHGRLIQRRREWAIALAISLAIFGAWLLAAWHLGVMEAQARWTSTMAGQTTRSLRGSFYALDALFTKLPSGFGVYSLPLLALGVAGRAALARRTVHILGAWIALVCVPLLFTLPDNRYFLPAYPALAILGAVGLERLGEERVRALALAWLLCAITLAYYAGVDLKQRAFLFRTLFAPR